MNPTDRKTTGQASHGHDHEHFTCCGTLFHGRESYDTHKKQAHPGGR